ncbi:NADH-dependent flavin oxidoreductase [Streptococcus chenjunshii]|uniref:NADH-dependent flavin oxidoreductase n=1 Tax=Streptococcus chenjunshii TaxID=2173853 RepID=A0A372KKG1_9STRE|nr:NADH-dependent flavin oxidoreductase [Streptococcus chenjunshii]AXQ79692.1 NADH-dependent flavin oxidoreductase [Streptococcus chenjunshii]RFU50215.1 NADH-dependent flavin oxidoreductase [Streptococcus chenjunshii]RFU52394.1 NADH-dependent flavin oxidoreductase [Streptococcus chenjunshii]
MKERYEKLFEPYTFNNGVQLKNRLTVAPLTIYDSGEDGELTPAARNFWHNRFKGFGLYIMPFTNVHPSGIGFASPNAYDERHLETLKEYAQIAHEQGAKSVVQLAHSGIRAQADMTKGYGVVGPSQELFSGARALSSEEVAALVKAFAYAAELALLAGHDGVEIHGANGWLIQQFVSETFNRRDDEWGGSLEKRLHFPLAVIDAIDAVRQKHQRPDFIVGYRFSPEEPGEKGLTMKETFALVDALTEKPLQYLHVSLWDFYKKARRGADSRAYRMQLLHDRIGGRLPFIGVGNLYTADQIAAAYETGFAEFIAVGKSVMLNPDLIDKIKSGREDDIERQFDWDKADYYRYTPAMLEGTRQGMDFYPPSKQFALRYKSEEY